MDASMPLLVESPPAKVAASSDQKTPVQTGHRVRNVRVEKHPGLHTPNLSDPNNLAFSNHVEATDIIPINCPVSNAECIACQLHGSMGCSKVDART